MNDFKRNPILPIASLWLLFVTVIASMKLSLSELTDPSQLLRWMMIWSCSLIFLFLFNLPRG